MTKKLPVISSSELAYHDEFSGFLGAGGFGSVRRATWGANKQVAVKILFNLQPTQTPITKISEDTSFPKINTYIL